MESNGLQSFSFHALDPKNSNAVNELNIERNALMPFDTIERIAGLSNLDPESAARQHLKHAIESKALQDFSIPEVGNLTFEFKLLGVEYIPLTDTTTVKFREVLNKIPVYGSLVTVELDKDNERLAINSNMGGLNINSIASLAPKDALQNMEYLCKDKSDLKQATPQLHFYYDAQVQEWRLVYIVENIRPKASQKLPKRDLTGNNSEDVENGLHNHTYYPPLLIDVVVDAHDGEIVAQLPKTPSVQQITDNGIDELGRSWQIRCVADDLGNRTLHDYQLNVHTYDFGFGDIDTGTLPGKYVENPPTPWAGGAISAHVNAGIVADFLINTLHRNSIDNRGGAIISSVNCIVSRYSIDGVQWFNAAWIGTQMVYGQRKIQGKIRSYSVGLDVVAHELFHGVTEKTARLQYVAQTGALNEFYSDIFGVLVSNFSNPDISKWNWEMGEDLNGTGVPLRDISNPGKYRQADHMNNYKNLPNDDDHDNGGVHINSGIHNFAAYKVMASKDDAGNFIFQPSSLAALFYIALTQYLSATSTFSDSQRAVELVARSLFRNETSIEQDLKLNSISNAFQSVGIV